MEIEWVTGGDGSEVMECKGWGMMCIFVSIYWTIND